MKQPFAEGLLRRRRDHERDGRHEGPLPGGHWKTHPDADIAVFDGGRSASYPKPDGKYTFDKLSSVFITGNATRDDAPNHIRVQRVPRELAEMWQWMCPAGVYEVPEDAPAEGDVDVIVNYTNCVQCGAITAKGGRLTPPEGGDGAHVPQHLISRRPDVREGRNSMDTANRPGACRAYAASCASRSRHVRCANAVTVIWA